MKIEKEKFDERQLQIRGDIYKHGFLTACAFMLFNAFLQSEGIGWANGFHQNILMLIFALTVVSVEFHLRDVFFGIGGRRITFIAVFGFCTVLLLLLSVFHGVKGDKFVADHRLTDNGFDIVCGIMFFANTICALVQLFREKQAERTIK